MVTIQDEFGENIKEMYLSGIGCSTISKKFNISKFSVLSSLRNMGIQIKTSSQANRRYKINESYFDKIDTEDRAYFLGILYADGYVSEEFNKVRLSLIESDREILDKLSKFIYKDRPLLFLKKANISNMNQFSLDVSSKKIVCDLVKHGCVQCKTFKIRLPRLDNKLLCHFIRGYFDGDGHIKTNEGYRKKAQFSITSNIKFCEDLQNLFFTMGISSKIYPNKKNAAIASIMISNLSNILLVREYIYSNATIFMQRKRDKFFLIRKKPHRGWGEFVKITPLLPNNNISSLNLTNGI